MWVVAIQIPDATETTVVGQRESILRSIIVPVIGCVIVVLPLSPEATSGRTTVSSAKSF